MRRGHAGIYRRGGYAYARAGAAAVAAALLNQAHENALAEDAKREAFDRFREDAEEFIREAAIADTHSSDVDPGGYE